MKASATFGNFEVRYIQVPYDNRYHIVLYKDKEIMKIPNFEINLENYSQFWGGFVNSNVRIEYLDIINRYFQRVAAKDIALDANDGYD